MIYLGKANMAFEEVFDDVVQSFKNSNIAYKTYNTLSVEYSHSNLDDCDTFVFVPPSDTMHLSKMSISKDQYEQIKYILKNKCAYIYFVQNVRSVITLYKLLSVEINDYKVVIWDLNYAKVQLDSPGLTWFEFIRSFDLEKISNDSRRSQKKSDLVSFYPGLPSINDVQITPPNNYKLSSQFLISITTTNRTPIRKILLKKHIY
jgi:hypothetical protein